MGDRVTFFLAVSALSLLLVPVTPDQFKWVTWALVGSYAIFALAFFLDGRYRRRG